MHSRILPSKLGIMGQCSRNSHHHKGCWLNWASARLSCSAETPHAFPGKSLLKEKLCVSQGLVVSYPFCPLQNTQLDLPWRILPLGNLLQVDLW